MAQLDAELIFALLDMDGGGDIALDEFCECFRLQAQTEGTQVTSPKLSVSAPPHDVPQHESEWL